MRSRFFGSVVCLSPCVALVLCGLSVCWCRPLLLEFWDARGGVEGCCLGSRVVLLVGVQEDLLGFVDLGRTAS